MARWKRLVERQFPQQAAAGATSSNRNGQQASAYANNGSGRGRGGGGANRGSRGNPRGGSSYRGTGSRVNPRPTSTGPPAKVPLRITNEIRIQTYNKISKVLLPLALQFTFGN